MGTRLSYVASVGHRAAALKKRTIARCRCVRVKEEWTALSARKSLQTYPAGRSDARSGAIADDLCDYLMFAQNAHYPGPMGQAHPVRRAAPSKGYYWQEAG